MNGWRCWIGYWVAHTRKASTTRKVKSCPQCPFWVNEKQSSQTSEQLDPGRPGGGRGAERRRSGRKLRPPQPEHPPLRRVRLLPGGGGVRDQRRHANALSQTPRSADGIVVASPIYWSTLNAQAKLCIDRWYALEGPGGSALAGKQFGLILTYGDVDPYTSGAINAIRTFQDMCRYIKAELSGIVYGAASDPGEIQSQPKLLERAYQLGQQLGH